MARLVIHPEKIEDIAAFAALCPFGAIESSAGEITISAACKMCRICVKRGPVGGVEYIEDAPVTKLDKSLWQGIAVYVDHVEGDIHPVTLELIGKARELVGKSGQQVSAVYFGRDESCCAELLHYGVDKVYCYCDLALERFSIEPYTALFEHFVEHTHPSGILVGATTVGRQLAPRVAARLRTGLTADCTILDMQQNELIQIRPAFGGNIMAEIVTPAHRPQMATVRYKVMDAPARSPESSGELVRMAVPAELLRSNLVPLSVLPKAPEEFIEGVDVLIAAGRGVKKKEDLQLLGRLAELLGGQLACTRPLIENGWMEAKRQIGLSGRTVRPRLIIACGISGAIQFVAGMNQSDTIVAINKDEKAPIFRAAHYGLVGDLYEIIPRLIAKIEAGRETA